MMPSSVGPPADMSGPVVGRIEPMMNALSSLSSPWIVVQAVVIRFTQVCVSLRQIT